MPRLSGSIYVNGQPGVGWFMDFGLEEESHCGTLPLNKNIPSG
jgi:hypothetical protein